MANLIPPEASAELRRFLLTFCEKFGIDAIQVVYSRSTDDQTTGDRVGIGNHFARIALCQRFVDWHSNLDSCNDSDEHDWRSEHETDEGEGSYPQ